LAADKKAFGLQQTLEMERAAHAREIKRLEDEHAGYQAEANAIFARDARRIATLETAARKRRKSA
jgi:hypothetical protein